MTNGAAIKAEMKMSDFHRFWSFHLFWVEVMQRLHHTRAVDSTARVI